MIEKVYRIAVEAGEKILEVRRSGDTGVKLKADASPVTLADMAANECIVRQLRELSSDPIISEESSPDGKAGTRFWLVDPLDGTKDFVAGKDSFVVSIGLIENGRPITGVVYAPVLGELYWAERGKGAKRAHAYQGVKSLGSGDASQIRMIFNHSRRTMLKVLASGTHMSPRMREFLDALPIAALERYGSALKLCRVAEGEADLYPRFGPTSEWDTAAGHAILLEAGCKLVEMETGRELLYGKPRFLNPGFIASRADLDFVEIALKIRAQLKRD